MARGRLSGTMTKGGIKGEGRCGMRTVRRETWHQYRRRIIRETERFVEWGLAHPDEVIPVPAKRAGTEEFPRDVARWFWGVVLTSRTGSHIERLRDKLRLGSALARLRRRG